MPTRNINLTDRFDKFVEEGILSGRYKNASEVIRAGLRLLEEQERENALKLERLREAARAGYEAWERGDYIEIGPDDLDSVMDRLEIEAEALVRARADGH